MVMVSVLVLSLFFRIHPDAVTLEMEEEAVYAAYFSQDYFSRYDRIVIQNRTCICSTLNADLDHFYRKCGKDSSDPDVRNQDPVNLLGIRLSKWDLDQDVLKSFHERNEQCVHHRKDMDLGIEYVLLPQEEHSRIFSDMDGWSRFRKKFHKAPGVTGLSKVGFSEDRTVAMLYVGTQVHWLLGQGGVTLFKKINGVWKKVDWMRTWVS
jgi:hypothetical protein